MTPDTPPVKSANPCIECEISVSATAEEVWEAWTTLAGVKSFFAPEANIELRPGGAYEMLFNPAAAPGEQGGEGMIIMALEQPEMLSFSWNAPPHLPRVRGQMTHVTLRIQPVTGTRETRVILFHDGWGKGGEWDQAYAYFQRAWGDIVLPRLRYRFEQGPVDWDNPPSLD